MLGGFRVERRCVRGGCVGGCGRRDGPLNELDQGHAGAVALAGAELHDARVAAGAGLEARGDVIEKELEHAAIGENRAGLPSCMQSASLAERNHLLRRGADRLRFRLGRHDPLMAQQFGDLIANQGLAVG